MDQALEVERIKEIAIKFFSQHYSVSSVKSIEMEDGLWKVTLDGQAFGDKTIKIFIDPNIRKILKFA